MKSKCSFILKASTALVLALLMLFGTVTTSLAAVVDNAATGRDAEIAETGWTINGGKVYFDASSITVDSTHKLQICIYGTDTNDYNRDCAHFESLSKVEGTDSIYYAQVNGIGSKMNNPWGLCFFTAGTTWGDYNVDNCNDPDVLIYTNNIKKNAAWYSDTYGTDLSSGNTYFINPASSSNGAGLTVGTSVPSSFSYNQTAKVSIKAVGASSYTTKNSSNTSTGGTLKITGKVWSGKAVANSSTTASNYSASMNSAVKSSYAKLTTTTYSGYTFDGWYSTNTGTGTQYTTTTGYKVTGATTTYGRYSENANTVTFTKKLGSSAATTITTKQAGVSTEATYTAPDESGYNFTGWTITSGAANATNVTGTESASSTTVSLNATGAVTVQANYEQSGVPSLDAISNVSKDANTTTFNVTATISDEDKKSGTLTATAASGTTSVATVDTPTVSGSTVTIPVTVKGPGSSTITVTLKDGTTTLNSQTFKVTVADPTFTISAKTIDVTAKNTALTISQSPAPSSGTTYTSNNSDYISVNSSGQVTAAKTPTAEQTATITGTATYGCGYTKTATATVTLNAPTLVVQSSKTSGYINDTATASIKSSTNPTVSDSTVTAYKWTTSDSSIVALSSTTAASPTLTFKKNGTATINLQVTYKNTSLKKTSANVSITVNKPTIDASNVEVAQGDTKQLSATTSNPNGLTIKYAEKTAATGFSVTEAGLVSVTTAAANNATYTVVATAYNASNEAVQTKEITVTAKTPSLDVKDGTTSKKDGTVYTTVNTPKTLNVSANFSDDLIAKSSDITVATVALSADKKTLTIDPKAKGTCKVSVSTDSGYAPTGVDIAATAAAMPDGIFKKVIEYAATGAVATQTVRFTVNVAEADTYHYVYFSNGGNWSSPVIHAWGANGTPANRASMTKIGVNDLSQDVYAYRFSATDWAKVQNIHFLSSAGATWSDASNADNTHTFTGTELSHNGFYNDGTYDLTLVKPQIQADNVTIDMGGTKTMTATVLTSGTPSTFNWSSGTASVATVANTHTATNVITGVAPGNSTITIKAYAAKPTGWTSIVTDGTADNFVAGTTTATANVVAENKTVSYSAQYSDNGSTWNNATATQGSFTVMDGNTTVNSGASLAYNTTLTLTATPASGYALEGIYKSIDTGSTWTKVSGATLALTDNYQLEARFIKVFKLSAFDSYELKNNSTVSFVTAPPKSIKVKHGDTTYTYSYDGTKAAGNPDSPDGTKPAALPIADDTYGQGNYIQYYAGDEITLTYSAMASSEILKGVFYNNDNGVNFFVNKPTEQQFVQHDYATGHTIYRNTAYYTGASDTYPGVTVDNDAHSIKFTGTQDYKNIDVEIGTKRKVYFSDYTNAVITSKNTDDYYYDGEALSVTGDQLTVAAAMSTVQTNKIDNSASSTKKPGFYRANADGSKGTALTSTEISNLGLSITTGTSTSTSSANGTALVISGNMPAYDLYIDLNMQNSYTLKLGTLVVSSLGESGIERLRQKATAISITGNNTLNASTTAKVTTGSTSVNTGSAATLTVTGITSGYMFVGWYWGDDSAPDYDKGFISDKQTLSYTPKKGGTIWAVGTKELFINGSKYITGKDKNWYAENNTQKNLEMSFDAETGRYYWEITDTMFAAAGNEYKTWEENNNNTTYGTYYKGGDNYYYWYDNDDKYHGKSFFQLFDTESGNNNKSIWDQLTSFKVDTPANGPTYGKIYPSADDYRTKTWNGQGFINFYESGYHGYSSPLRIYYDPNASGNARLSVEATEIYSDIYVSNGYDVGSTKKTDDVTVQPVVGGVVMTSGQTGYFSVGASTTYNPWNEGKITKYTPAKKAATLRITKKVGGNDKVSAFFIYDLDTKTVRAEKNVTKSGNTYYTDLTLAGEKQRLYVVPIIEEAVPEGAKQVTITFDATQLNRKQWGDIVTAYAWYSSTNDPALGAYPGQPMIPSDDMSTWTTSFVSEKDGHELAGITFSNYVDGENKDGTYHGHSWLGETGVMGTVSDHATGTAEGGIINVYNHVDSGTNGEYSRTNYKAQTYDYHEPIALYDKYKNEDSIEINFQMKDGNSSLISWYHKDLVNTSNNILNPSEEKWRLNFEYLTNAKGDQYVDMNGKELGGNNKPTASFFVASKGLAVYKNSTMKYLFDSGQNYEMQGYEATYSRGSGDRGSYTRNTGGWSSAITYGGINGLDMKYAVQWYVYDAQGNYITTVLSAGIADLASGSADTTYIAQQLENMGYAVDGKSVAICYDKPRYMYGDWDKVTDSADDINSGPDFNAYRFEGQWIAAADSDTVKVNVEVAMMTDSGEVLAHSNTAGYGNATASFRSGITFGKPDYKAVAANGSWAQTAATDAKLNGIELNASAQNFIGWYYYDANTGEFTKATYTSNEKFYPNYSNKDVTYYAVYRASAVYNYIYRGRESTDDMSTWRVYSASGEDLTPEEMEAGTNQNKVQYDNHTTDVLAKLPVGIGIFKKNIDFSAANAGSWDKDSTTDYILKLSGFSVTIPEYTLTYTYKKTNGSLETKTVSAAYNTTAVNLTSINGGTPVTAAYGTDEHKFLGWYEYDGNTIGDLLSTQANYGMRLTRNQSIIAVYEGDGTALPTDGWTAHIDENVLNKELTTSTTGVFYNDTIVRVRNSSDVKATLPGDAKIGVLVVTKNGKTTKEPDAYSKDQLTTLADGIASGETKSTKSGLVITNMQANTQTSFNRTDIAVRADYKSTVGAQYCVYAYIKIGNNYYFSAHSAVKTYE